MPKVTTADGTTIAYDKRGGGPVLILVLGALNKRGSGKKLAERLAGKFTTVSYDRRGRGDSTDTLPYSVDKEIQDISTLIGELGGKAFLYGHSSGAILALLAAKKLGDKVAGLALYELPYNSEPGAVKVSKSYRKELQKLIDKDKSGEAVALFVKSVGVTDKQVEAMKRLPIWKSLTAMAPTLAYDTIKLMEEYPKINVKSIKAPSLIMAGGTSPPFMQDAAKKLSESLPNAEMRVLEGQAHDVKAEVIAPVLAEFFK